VRDGVIVVDKPKGPTSNDVVQRVRRALKVDRVGHTGTLDPMATGVLPLCIGEGTKIVQLLQSNDKAYEATIQLGAATDTLDAEGKVVEAAAIPAKVNVEAALVIFCGTYLQKPPMYSAVKVGGKRLHEAAREGLEVERASREVTVHSLELLERGADFLRVKVDCSKGFYVRVLADELSRALGTVGHLSKLRRTRAGNFLLQQAVTLDEACAGKGLISLETAIQGLQQLRVDSAEVARVLCGGKVAAPPLTGPVCVLGPEGKLLAIADVVDGALRYRRVMAR
jgi:tRNA pseudouridine55 synthase